MAHANGRPHAFAWNIGTTASTREDIREWQGKRVQHQRPVRVQHPFRTAGRTGRVAHDCCALLVDVVELRTVFLPRQQLRVIQRAFRHVSVVADHDDAAIPDVRPHGLEDGPEHLVDDEDAVVGVLDDVAQFLRVQADVQRVEHRARRGDAVVGLQVTGMIPAKRGDTIAAADAERPQRRSEPAGVSEALVVGRSADAAVGAPTDDLLVRKQRSRTPQQRRNRQRHVHHEPAHADLPYQGPIETP
jgi:hypothetical protein